MAGRPANTPTACSGQLYDSGDGGLSRPAGTCERRQERHMRAGIGLFVVAVALALPARRRGAGVCPPPARGGRGGWPRAERRAERRDRREDRRDKREDVRDRREDRRESGANAARIAGTRRTRLPRNSGLPRRPVPGAGARIPVPRPPRRASLRRMYDCDVIVIGGGPAGSTAATALARAGRSGRPARARYLSPLSHRRVAPGLGQ